MPRYLSDDATSHLKRIVVEWRDTSIVQIRSECLSNLTLLACHREKFLELFLKQCRDLLLIGGWESIMNSATNGFFCGNDIPTDNLKCVVYMNWHGLLHESAIP